MKPIKRIAGLVFAGFIGAVSLHAQTLGVVPAPAPKQQKVVAIIGGTAHIGNGKVLENATILLSEGKITAISNEGLIWPADAERIDASGKHIYPGLIAVASTVGLREIDAVRATVDYAETGLFNPHVRALVAYNAESRLIPTLRSNGVLQAQIAPAGGIISGSSSVVQLDAWNWEDAVVKTDDAIYLNWPPGFTGGGWWAEPAAHERNVARSNNLQQLHNLFATAKAYQQPVKGQELDQRLLPMHDLFTGKKKLFIRVGLARDIMESVAFAKQYGIQQVVIVGAQDAALVADFLKQHKVQVVFNQMHELPVRPDDDILQLYTTPKVLSDAGVLFCIAFTGDMEVMRTRNLAFAAGNAAAHGLEKEKALQSITLDAARILGTDKQTGSLQVGKDATLFISTGDALDMHSNNVEAAFIQGRSINLDHHQLQLYRKYSQKYEQAAPKN